MKIVSFINSVFSKIILLIFVFGNKSNPEWFLIFVNVSVRKSLKFLNRLLFSIWFVNKLKIRNIKYKIIEDPCYFSKAIKNKTEINGAKKANIRDGVSVTKFLYWLKNQITFKKLNEISAIKKNWSNPKKWN